MVGLAPSSVVVQLVAIRQFCYFYTIPGPSLSLCSLRDSAVAHHIYCALSCTLDLVCTCMDWDIDLLISAVTLFVMHFGGCLKCLLVKSCIPTAFYPWPRWSFVLFGSCCCFLIGVYTRCTLNRNLPSVSSRSCRSPFVFSKIVHWLKVVLGHSELKLDALWDL